jgi:UDP-N-acetylmuramoyl-tripeptide--D-alanyl-D-alanine ligase
MISTEELYSHYLDHPVVCTDTRTLTAGCIFFALKGPSFDGNRFADHALANGAAYAVVDDPQVVRDNRFLLVEDVLTALQQLAKYHRRQLGIPVLAITGSNGKTTTKELVRAVLAKKFNVYATRGNLNNHIGVPLTLLSMNAKVEFAVVEMGANHQGEIASYCAIAEPDYGLITNVGKAHLEGFGGFAGVKKGKGELYTFLSAKKGRIFLHASNVHLQEMAEERKPLEVVTYGSLDGCDCKGELVSYQPFLTISWQYGNRHGEIQTQLVGRYNFENILSAIAIGNFFDVPAVAIDEAIAAYAPDNSRSQVVKRGTNTIILDAYNANPTSMEAAIRNLNAMEGENKVVCIGDMAELGEESDREHERIVQLLQENDYAKILLVGVRFGKYAAQLDALHFSDSIAAAEWIRKNPFEHSIILIKGSRSSRMEVVMESL